MRSFRLNFSLAISSALLLVLTLTEADWIEVAFHVDPDGGNGALEWGIVGVSCVATLSFGVLAALAAACSRPQTRTTASWGALRRG
jgi:hypothetical protein